MIDESDTFIGEYLKLDRAITEFFFTPEPEIHPCRGIFTPDAGARYSRLQRRSTAAALTAVS
ncbi:MAG: hypothetical protein JW801_02090 [Bacteroidales bacterium]|nr:hypothetical protein [Bacteroidales bacterium]